MDVLTDALMILPKYTDDPWNPKLGLGDPLSTDNAAITAMNIRYGVVWPNNNHIFWKACEDQIKWG